MNQIDFKSVEEFFNLVYVPGHCCEVRIFSAMVDFKSHRIVRCPPNQEFTVSGWFTSYEELECELNRIENVSVYISVNPIPLRSRPHHAKNNLKVLRKGDFVTDSHVDMYKYFIVDIDPIRLQGNSKVNSTNKELFECINVRDTIIKEIGLENNCIYGISGNGSFILIALPDCKNEDTTIIKLSKFINHLSQKYSNQHCVIDTNTKNASRHLALPGCWKYRNAVSSPDRPHRRAEIHGIHDDQQTRSIRH
jgi:hypothetical protein